MATFLRKVIHDAYRRECDVNNVDPSLNVLRWIEHTESFTDFSFIINNSSKHAEAADVPSAAPRSASAAVSGTIASAAVHSDATSFANFSPFATFDSAAGASTPSISAASAAPTTNNNNNNNNNAISIINNAAASKYILSANNASDNKRHPSNTSFAATAAAPTMLPSEKAQATQAAQYFSRTKRFVVNPADTTARRKLNAVSGMLRLIPTLTAVGFQSCGMMPNLVANVIEFVSETCEAQQQRMIKSKGTNDRQASMAGTDEGGNDLSDEEDPLYKAFVLVAKSTKMGSAEEGLLSSVDLRGNKLTIMEFHRLCELVTRHPQLTSVRVDASDFYPLDVLTELCEKNAASSAAAAIAAAEADAAPLSSAGGAMSDADAEGSGVLFANGGDANNVCASPRSWITGAELRALSRAVFPLEPTFSAITAAIVEGSGTSTGMSGLFFQFLLADVVLAMKKAVAEEVCREDETAVSADQRNHQKDTHKQEINNNNENAVASNPIVLDDFAATMRNAFRRFALWRRGHTGCEALFHIPIPNERAIARCCVCGTYCDGFTLSGGYRHNKLLTSKDFTSCGGADNGGEETGNGGDMQRLLLQQKHQQQRNGHDDDDDGFFDYENVSPSAAKSPSNGRLSPNGTAAAAADPLAAMSTLTGQNNNSILILAKALFDPSAHSTLPATNNATSSSFTSAAQHNKSMNVRPSYGGGGGYGAAADFDSNSNNTEASSSVTYRSATWLLEYIFAAVGTCSDAFTLSPADREMVLAAMASYGAQPADWSSGVSVTSSRQQFYGTAADIAYGGGGSSNSHLLQQHQQQQVNGTTPLFLAGGGGPSSPSIGNHHHQPQQPLTLHPRINLPFGDRILEAPRVRTTACARTFAVLLGCRAFDFAIGAVPSDACRHVVPAVPLPNIVDVMEECDMEVKVPQTWRPFSEMFPQSRGGVSSGNSNSKKKSDTDLSTSNTVAVPSADSPDASYLCQWHVPFGTQKQQQVSSVASDAPMFNDVVTQALATLAMESDTHTAAAAETVSNSNDTTSQQQQQQRRLQMLRKFVEAGIGAPDMKGLSILAACQQTVRQLPAYASWYDVLQRNDSASVAAASSYASMEGVSTATGNTATSAASSASSFDLVAYYLAFFRTQKGGPVRGSRIAFGIDLPISFFAADDGKDAVDSTNATSLPPFVAPHESFILGTKTFSTVVLLHSLCSHEGTPMVCGTAPNGRAILLSRAALNAFAARFDAVAYITIEDYHAQLGIARRHAVKIRRAALTLKYPSSSSANDATTEKEKTGDGPAVVGSAALEAQKDRNALIEAITRPEILRGVVGVPMAVIDRPFEAETLLRVLMYLSHPSSAGNVNLTETVVPSESLDAEFNNGQHQQKKQCPLLATFRAFGFAPPVETAAFVDKLLLAQELLDATCRREALKLGEPYAPCLSSEEVASLRRLRDAFVAGDVASADLLVPELLDGDLLRMASGVLKSVFVKEQPEALLWELKIPRRSVEYLTDFLAIWESARSEADAKATKAGTTAEGREMQRLQASPAGMDTYDLLVSKRFPFDYRKYVPSSSADVDNEDDSSADSGNNGIITAVEYKRRSSAFIAGLNNSRRASISENNDKVEVRKDHSTSAATIATASQLTLATCAVTSLRQLQRGLAAYRLGSIPAIVAWARSAPAPFARAFAACVNRLHGHLTPIISRTVHPSLQSTTVLSAPARIPKPPATRPIILTEASVSTSGLFETFSNPDCLLAADDDENDFSVGSVSKEVIRRELEKKKGRPALRVFGDDDYPVPFITIDAGFDVSIARMTVDLSYGGLSEAPQPANMKTLLLLQQRSLQQQQIGGGGVGGASTSTANRNASLSPPPQQQQQRPQSSKRGRKLLVEAANKMEEASAGALPTSTGTGGGDTPNIEVTRMTPRPATPLAENSTTGINNNNLSATAPTRQRSLSQVRLRPGAFTPHPTGPISLGEASAYNISAALGGGGGDRTARNGGADPTSAGAGVSRHNSIFNNDSVDASQIPYTQQQQEVDNSHRPFNGVPTVVVEASIDGRRYDTIQSFPILVGSNVTQSLSLPFKGAFRFWKLLWENVPRVTTDADGKDNFDHCPHITKIQVFAHSRSFVDICGGSVAGSLVKGSLLADSEGNKCGQAFVFPLLERGVHKNGSPTHHLRYLVCARQQMSTTCDSKSKNGSKGGGGGGGGARPRRLQRRGIQLVGALIDDSFDSYEFLTAFKRAEGSSPTEEDTMYVPGLHNLLKRPRAPRPLLLEERYGYWATLGALGHTPSAAITTTKAKTVFLISRIDGTQYVSRCDKGTGALIDPPMPTDGHFIFAALPYPFDRAVDGSFPLSDSVVLLYSGLMFTLFDITLRRPIIPTQSWHSNLPGRPMIEKNGFGNHKDIPPAASLFCFPFRTVSIILPDFSSLSDVLMCSGSDAVRWRFPSVEDIVMYYHSPFWRISDKNPRFPTPECVLAAEAAPFLITTTYVKDLVESVLAVDAHTFRAITDLCVTYTSDNSAPQGSIAEEASVSSHFIAGHDLTQFNSFSNVHSHDRPFVCSPQPTGSALTSRPISPQPTSATDNNYPQPQGQFNTANGAFSPTIGDASSSSMTKKKMLLLLDSHCEIVFKIAERTLLSSVVLVGTTSGCRLVLEALPSSLDWPPRGHRNGALSGKGTTASSIGTGGVEDLGFDNASVSAMAFGNSAQHHHHGSHALGIGGANGLSKGAARTHGDWTFVSRIAIESFVTVIPIPATMFPASMFRLRTEHPTNCLSLHRILLAQRLTSSAVRGTPLPQPHSPSSPANKTHSIVRAKEDDAAAPTVVHSRPPPIALAPFTLQATAAASATQIVDCKARIVLTQPLENRMAKGIRIHLTRPLSASELSELFAAASGGIGANSSMPSRAMSPTFGGPSSAPPPPPPPPPPPSQTAAAAAATNPLARRMSASTSLMSGSSASSAAFTVTISRDSAIFIPVKVTLTQIEGLGAPQIDLLFAVPVAARVLALAIAPSIVGDTAAGKLITGCAALMGSFDIVPSICYALSEGGFNSNSNSNSRGGGVGAERGEDFASGSGVGPKSYRVNLPVGRQCSLVRIVGHLRFSQQLQQQQSSLGADGISPMASSRPQQQLQCNVTILKGEKNLGALDENDGFGYAASTIIASQSVRLDNRAEIDITLPAHALGADGTANLLVKLSHPRASIDHLSLWYPRFPALISITDAIASNSPNEKNASIGIGKALVDFLTTTDDSTTERMASRSAIIAVNHHLTSQFNPIGLRISASAVHTLLASLHIDQPTRLRVSGFAVTEAPGAWTVGGSLYSKVTLFDGRPFSQHWQPPIAAGKTFPIARDLEVLFGEPTDGTCGGLTPASMFDFIELELFFETNSNAFINGNKNKDGASPCSDGAASGLSATSDEGTKTLSRKPKATSPFPLEQLISDHVRLLINPAHDGSALDHAHTLSPSQMKNTLAASVLFAGSEARVTDAGGPIQMNLQTGARLRFSSRHHNQPLQFSGVSVEIIGNNTGNWSADDHATFSVECVSASEGDYSIVGYIRTGTGQPLVWIGNGSRSGAAPSTWRLVLCAHSRENCASSSAPSSPSFHQNDSSNAAISHVHQRYSNLEGASANTTAESVTVLVRFYSCPVKTQTAPFVLGAHNATFSTNVLGKQTLAEEQNYLLSQVHSQTPSGPPQSRMLDLLAVEGIVEIKRSNASVLGGANSIKGIANNAQGNGGAQEPEMRSVAGGSPSTTVLYIATHIKGEPQAFTKISVCTITDANHEFSIQYSDDGNNFTTAAIHAQREGWCTTSWQFCGFHSYWRIAASLLPGSVAMKRTRKSTASSASFLQDNDDRLLGELMQNVNPSALTSVRWFTALPPALSDAPDSTQVYSQIIGLVRVQNRLRIPQHDTTLLLAFPIGFGTKERQAAVKPETYVYDPSRSISQTLQQEEKVKKVNMQKALMRVVHGKVSSLALRSATQIEERIDEALPRIEDIFSTLDKFETDRIRSIMRVFDAFSLDKADIFAGSTPESGMPYVGAVGIVTSDTFGSRSKRASVRFQFTCPPMSLCNNPRVVPHVVIAIEAINSEGLIKLATLQTAISDTVGDPRMAHEVLSAFDWAVGYHIPVDRGAARMLTRQEEARAFARKSPLLIRSSFDTMFGATAGEFNLPSGQRITPQYEVPIRAGASIILQCSTFADLLRFLRQDVPSDFLGAEDGLVVGPFSRAEAEAQRKKKASEKAEFDDDSQFMSLDSPDFIAETPNDSKRGSVLGSSDVLRVISTLCNPSDDVVISISWETNTHTPSMTAAFSLPGKNLLYETSTLEAGMKPTLTLHPVHISVTYFLDRNAVSIVAETAVSFPRISSSVLAARFVTSTEEASQNFPRLIHGGYQAVSDVEKGISNDHTAVMCGHITIDTVTKLPTRVGNYAPMLGSLASLVPSAKTWASHVFVPGMNPSDVGISHAMFANDLQLLGASATKTLRTVAAEVGEMKRKSSSVVPPVQLASSPTLDIGNKSLNASGTCVWNGILHKCWLDVSSGATVLSFSSDAKSTCEVTKLTNSLAVTGTRRDTRISNTPVDGWEMKCRSDTSSIHVKVTQTTKERKLVIFVNNNTSPITCTATSTTIGNSGMESGAVDHCEWKTEWLIPVLTHEALKKSVTEEISKITKECEVTPSAEQQQSNRPDITVLISNITIRGFDDPIGRIGGSLNGKTFVIFVDLQLPIVDQLVQQIRILFPRIFF